MYSRFEHISMQASACVSGSAANQQNASQHTAFSQRTATFVQANIVRVHWLSFLNWVSTPACGDPRH